MNTKTMSSKIEEKMTELKNYVWYPEYRIKYSEYEEDIEYICGGYYMCEGDCDFETFDSIFQWCGGAYHADDNGNPIVEDKDASVTKLSPQEAELVYRNLIIELVVDGSISFRQRVKILKTKLKLSLGNHWDNGEAELFS